MNEQKLEVSPVSSERYDWIDLQKHSIIFDESNGEKSSISEDFVRVERGYGQSWTRANLIEPAGIFFYSLIYALFVFFLHDYGTGDYNPTLNAFLFPIFFLILVSYKGSQTFFRSLFIVILFTLFVILPYYNNGLVTVTGLFLTNLSLRFLNIATSWIDGFELFNPANLNTLSSAEIFLGVLGAVFIFQTVFIAIMQTLRRFGARPKIDITISNQALYFREQEGQSRWAWVELIFALIISPFNVKRYIEFGRRLKNQREMAKDSDIYDYAKLNMDDILDLKRVIYRKKGFLYAGLILIGFGALIFFDIIPIINELVANTIELKYLIAGIPAIIGLVFIFIRPPKICNLVIRFDKTKTDGSLFKASNWNVITLYHLKLDLAEKVTAAKELILSEDYQDYYIIKNNRPHFDLYSYRHFDKGKNLDLLAKLLVWVIALGFIAYGIWNIYYLVVYLQTTSFASVTEIWEVIGGYIKEYGPNIAYIFTAIWFTTLLITQGVVRVFGKLAAFFMYMNVVLQVIVFIALYFYINEWEYRWVFLIPVLIQAIILIFFNKKFRLAIKFVKISSKTVANVKGLIVPQIYQTVLTVSLGVLHFAITSVSLLKLHETSIQILDWTISNTDIWVYAVMCVFFVLLSYLIIYAALGCKMIMVHEYYRGGKPRIIQGFRIVSKRFWQLMGYALTSTIIHLMQFLYKLFKGEVKVESILDAAELTQELAPTNPMSFDKKKTIAKVDKGKIELEKKKIPIHDRIWFGMNYFTLPAMMLRDQKFIPALLGSMKLIIKKLPDLYIKKSNVNVLFRYMQWGGILLSGIVGGLVGAVVANMYSLNLYAMVVVCAGIFYWIAGMTAAIVLNDLNMTYIEVMYMHSLDQKYDKKGFSRFEVKEANQFEKKLLEALKKQEEHEAKKKKEEEIAKSEPKIGESLADFQPDTNK